MPSIPETAFKLCQVGIHVYWCFTLCTRIPGLDKIRLVISFKATKPSGMYAVLISDRKDWLAKQ
ncbi:MAG: hypothetical protein AAGF01_18615, partial [Cyanobacteria bacterium P01_G01_bin.38]